LVCLLGFLAIRTSIRPLGVLTGTVNRMSAGDLSSDIPYAEKRNEFGDIARALLLFRDSARAKLEIEARSAEQRREADAERSRNDAEKHSLDDQINFAVGQLGAGLERLAHGDLSRTIDTPFAGRLEQLRADFNGSLLRLQDSLVHIRWNALSIQ